MLLNWLQAHTREGPLADRLAASTVTAANTGTVGIVIASASVRTQRYMEEIRQVMKEIERALGLQLQGSPERTEEGGDETSAYCSLCQ